MIRDYLFFQKARLKLLFIFTSLSLWCSSVLAQKNSQFYAGAAYFYSKDEIISSSIFEGKTTKLSVDYSFSPQKKISFIYLYGDLYSVTGQKWQVLSPKLSFDSFLFELKTKRTVQEFGFSLSLDGMWTTSKFSAGGVLRNGRKSGYLNSFISFEYRSKITLSQKNVLEPTVGLPIFYYTVRPGYSTLDPDRIIGDEATALDIAKSGEFRTLLNQPSFQTGVTLYHIVSEKIQLAIVYDYHFLTIDFPRKYSSINQTLQMGIKWKL